MKTTINILLLLAFLQLAEMQAQTYVFSGTLTRKVEQIITSPGSTVTDCDGVQSTIASSQSTRITLDPISINSWVIRIFKSNADTNNFGSASYSINSSNVANASNASTFPNNVNYSSSSHADRGKFTITLTNLAKSRFNYFAKVYLNGENQSTYTEEFPINNVPGIPIGTVYAYVGNASTIADLEVNGWYKCDGRLVSNLPELTSDEKTALQNIVGNNLPNLQGAFLRGLDEGQAWDDGRFSRTGGENHANGAGTGVRSYQGDLIGTHNHTGSTNGAGGHDHGGWTGGVGNHNHGGSTNSESISFSAQADENVSNTPDLNAIVNGEDNETSRSHSHGISPDGAHSHSIPSVGDHSHTVSISSTGGAETRPENVAVYWLIRGR